MACCGKSPLGDAKRMSSAIAKRTPLTRFESAIYVFPTWTKQSNSAAESTSSRGDSEPGRANSFPPREAWICRYTRNANPSWESPARSISRGKALHENRRALRCHPAFGGLLLWHSSRDVAKRWSPVTRVRASTSTVAAKDRSAGSWCGRGQFPRRQNYLMS